MRRAGPKDVNRAAAFNPLSLAATPTTCCFGLLTVRGAAQVVGVVTILEGVCQFGTWMPSFLWGPPSYDWLLQHICSALGLLSICAGALCLRGVRRLEVRSIANAKRFRNFHLLWTCLWFCLVGLPTEIVYRSVPLIDGWPASAIPGMPKKLVVDPDWPNGKPHVCRDMSNMKDRLTTYMTSTRRNPLVRNVFGQMYTRVLGKVLPCKQVVQMFWCWMAAEMAVKVLCAGALARLELVVLNGGDGRMMIGDPADLGKPIGDRKGTKDLLRYQIQFFFEQVDSNGDGRVSLQELTDYIEGLGAP